MRAAIGWVVVWAGVCGAQDAFDPEPGFAEFEHALWAYYAYVERDDFDVAAHLERTRAQALEAEDTEALRAVLQRSIVAFTDPHLALIPRADDDFNVWPTSGDLALRWEDAAYVVVDVRAESPADRAGVRPGWVVESVDGVAIDDGVAAALGWVPAPTPRQRSYAATLVVNGRRDERPREVVFAQRGSLQLENPRLFAREVEARPPVEVSVRDGVGWIRLNNSLGDEALIEAFDAAIAECVTLPWVVVDLRNTPSGGNTNMARALIGHFVTEPRPYQMHTIPGIERQCSVPRMFVEYVLPRAPHYPGRVIALGGRWSGSMGEGTVIGLDAAADAIVFASDMGDLLGGVDELELQGGLGTLRMGIEALFHVNGTPRGDFVAECPLERSDRDADGGDPAWNAARACWSE